MLPPTAMETSNPSPITFGAGDDIGTEETAVPAKFTAPLKADEKTSILLNVEKGVKDVVGSLARKESIEGCDIDPATYEKLPNSFTGVVMHLVVAGLKAELDIAFDNPPKSLKQRGTAVDKKIEGKKRLLTRDEKNELLAKTQMSYYDKKIAAKDMTMEQALYAIKDAYEKKK